MSGTHTPSLVALSILIATIASYAALDIVGRLRASSGWRRRLWFSAAALAMGGGIWSMHFVAMLAFRMPGMTAAYEPRLTLSSLLIAILVTGTGLAMMNRWQGPRPLAAAGLVMGLGIVAMHYVGMAAMRMPAAIRYDPVWVALSVAIAILAATAALWMASRDRHPLQRAAAAIVMGLAIAGMHHAGMAGAHFVARPDVAPGAGHAAGVGQTSLAIAVAAATLGILVIALLAATFDRRLAAVDRAETRAALRVQIGDVMRGETPEEALRRSSALIGEHFGVSRVGYGQLDAHEDVFDYQVCWTNGQVPPLLGRHPARAFGARIVAHLSAGRTVTVDDLMTDPLSAEPMTRQTAAAVKTRAILVVPFVRDGRLRTIVYLNGERPRRWTADEVRFMEEVAERTRQAVARAEAESDLRRLNATLEARIEERTQALQATEAALRQSQKMEAIGQLTGGIAHDFNNMLTGVIGNLELLGRRLADGRTDDLGRFVEAASGAAQRAAALTARLLAFSRRQPLDARTVDIGALVRALDDLLRTTLGDEILRSIEAPIGQVHAFVDPYQLENAILNLAINARDAMQAASKSGGGALGLTVTTVAIGAEAQALDLAPGRYASIAVIDNGIGMPAAMIDRVFDPFFTTKPIGQGTGLGLSMVYGFARQSGGQVRIVSRERKGTTVTLLLPAVDDLAEPAAPAPAKGVPRKAGGRRPVLFVEDDESVRPIIGQLLDDLGFVGVAAADAADAIPILASDRPLALMISDVGLPGMNGRELAEIARAHRPDLPILFVTGYAAKAADRASFLKPGMALITKPFELEALSAKIAEILG